MSTDKEREAFEAWAKEHGRIFLDTQPSHFGAMYKNQFTQEAWVGWQARAALASQQPAAGWKALDTAPQDGSWFLAMSDKDKRVRMVRWADYGGDRYPINDEQHVWGHAPTHWQPIPSLLASSPAQPPAPPAQPEAVPQASRKAAAVQHAMSLTDDVSEAAAIGWDAGVRFAEAQHDIGTAKPAQGVGE